MIDFDALGKFVACGLGGNTRVRVSDLKGGDHLGLLVVSDEFHGRPLLEQHKMVMDILKEKLKEEIHAVKIKTLTFDKAKQKNIQI